MVMRRLSIQISILFVLLSVVFWRMFYNLGRIWSSDMDYSHCFLIPFVLAYIIYEKRHGLSKCKITGFWSALPVFVFSCLLAFFGILMNQPFSQHVAFILMIVGLIAFNSGWKITKTLTFPLFLMLFIFPLPHTLKARITFPLQIISSKIAVDLLRCVGISVYRDGNIIDLGTVQLQTVEACSGLRFLITLLVLAMLVGYFFQSKLWKRITLFVSAIPIAMAGNILRIAATGILAGKFGQKVAEGFFHSFSGWLVFIFSFAVLMGENFLLNLKGGAEVQRHKGTKAQRHRGTEGTINRAKFAISASGIGLVIIGLFFFSQSPSPSVKDLSSFPMSIAGWQANEDMTLSKRIFRATQATDYVFRDYLKNGNIIKFYLAFHDKDMMVHTPTLCMPGAGWEIVDHKTVKVMLGEKERKTSFMLLKKGIQTTAVLYWFQVESKVYPNIYVQKLYSFLDTFRFKKPTASLVRFIGVVQRGESVELVQERLTEFSKPVYPLVTDFVTNGKNIRKEK